MGFSDCRCLITGVSLKGSGAALLLLVDSDDRYVPIAPAIKGQSNRYGAVDMIDEDANTRLVLRSFLHGMRSGTFVVDENSLRRNHCFPIRTIEDLVQGFERNINDGAGHAVLAGRSVVFALIARVVWEAIARAAPPPAPSALAAARRLFEASPAWAAIGAGSSEEVAGPIAEFVAVDSFLRGRKIAWRPTMAGGQDDPEEMREYLDEAKRAFSDSPTILEALRDYEHEVGDLLIDEDE